MILQVLGVFNTKNKKENSLEQNLLRLDELQTEKFNLLINIGTLYFELENIKDCLDYYEKALIMAMNIKDDELQAFVLDAMGDVYLNDEQIIKALEYYNESLRIYSLKKSPLVEEIYDKIHEVEKAKEEVEMAELEKMRIKASSDLENNYDDYLNKVESRLDIIIKQVEAISVYEIYMDDEEPLIPLKEALKISKEIGDKSGEAALLLMIGNENLKTKDYDKASKILEKSIEKFNELEDENGVASSMIVLGTTNFMRKDIDGIAKNFRKAVGKFQQLENKNAESLAIEILNTLYNA
ncbi:MAG: tetratricopeptide repeat protein [Methanobacteriaceae archaeon]|nr:tetratricopeptide repeat protein [Methanobacteriaceae archaeon]